MRRGTSIRHLAVGAVCGLLFSGTASAATVSLSPGISSTCFLQTTGAYPSVTISGSGFSPQALVAVNLGGIPPRPPFYVKFPVTGSSFSDLSFQLNVRKVDYTNVPVNWTVSVSEAPIFTNGQTTGQTYDPANVVTISGQIIQRLVWVDGVGQRGGKYIPLKRSQFTGKRTWEFTGFQAGQPIYGHVMKGKKVLAHYRYGVAAAPCGGLTARATAIPGIARKKLKKGRYNINLNNSPTTTVPVEKVVITVPILK